METREWAVAVSLAVLLVISGCAGSASDATPGGTPTAASSTATSTPAPSPTSTPEPPNNPWEKDTIVVEIFAASDSEINRTEAVENAVSYWNDNRQFATYEVNFTVEPVSSDPDIRVKFVDDIHNCNYRIGGDAVGCSPVLSPDDRIYRTISMEIQTGWDQETTEEILKHEFGHILGLGHDDEPQSVMNSHIVASSSRQGE